MTTSPETPAPPRAHLPPSASAVIAFAILVVINVVFIAIGGMVRLSVRVWHHVFDAGHLFFLGSLLAVAILGWSRLRARSEWVASRRFGAETLVAALGVVAAYVFAREDFAGFASEAGGERGGAVILAALLLVVGLSPTIALLVARRLVRVHRFAPIGVGLAGLAAAVGNGRVLPADYVGIHLFLGIDAAVLLTVALSCVPLPRGLQRLGEKRFAAYVPAVILVLAAPSVIKRPDNAVRTQLARLDSAILVPILARFAWSADTRADLAGVPEELRPWVVDRKHGRPIPPSGKSLLPEKPIVILIGIDSLRADLFDQRDALAKMPNMVALRDRSLSFTMARSPGARTITTWSQTFSGRYVSGLRWRGDGNRLSIADDRTPRFSDFLHDAGVRTTTYVSYSALGKNGLARKFDEVVDIKAREGQSFGLSEQVVPKLIESFTQPHDGPRFYFAHFMDPHFPYDAGTKKGSNRAKFLSEVALADASIGKVWDALEKNDLLDRAVLVVTADHGEGFGEHDTQRHTVNLYEELIRVPMFIRIPGVKPRTIDEPVSLMDLGPTFLDLFSLPTPSSFLGQSLLPFARGKSPRLTRPIAAERNGTRAMLFGRKKVIVDQSRGRQEIYDLVDDPDEARNLADEMGAEGQQLIATLQAFFVEHSIGP
jgi:hypothetical protein